jgi:hypothetical protein
MAVPFISLLAPLGISQTRLRCALLSKVRVFRSLPFLRPSRFFCDSIEFLSLVFFAYVFDKASFCKGPEVTIVGGTINNKTFEIVGDVNQVDTTRIFQLTAPFEFPVLNRIHGILYNFSFRIDLR